MGEMKIFETPFQTISSQNDSMRSNRIVYRKIFNSDQDFRAQITNNLIQTGT